MYTVLCMAFIETSFEVVPLNLPREIKLLCREIYQILVFTLLIALFFWKRGSLVNPIERGLVIL